MFFFIVQIFYFVYNSRLNFKADLRLDILFFLFIYLSIKMLMFVKLVTDQIKV